MECANYISLKYKLLRAKTLSRCSCGLATYHGSLYLSADAICVDTCNKVDYISTLIRYHFTFHTIEPCTIFILYEYNLQTNMNMGNCIWSRPTTFKKKTYQSFARYITMKKLKLDHKVIKMIMKKLKVVIIKKFLFTKQNHIHGALNF